MITWTPGKTLAQLEKEIFSYALKLYNNNKDLVAESLGVSTKTVYNKLERYAKELEEDKKLSQSLEEREREFIISSRGGIGTSVTANLPSPKEFYEKT